MFVLSQAIFFDFRIFFLSWYILLVYIICCVYISPLFLFIKGGNVEEKIKQGSKQPVDILVGSVGALNKMFNAKFYSPNFIETVILDEIDTMVDDTFKGVTSNLLAQMRKIFDQQLIFAGATLPSNLDSQLGQVIGKKCACKKKIGLLDPNCAMLQK